MPPSAAGKVKEMTQATYATVGLDPRVLDESLFTGVRKDIRQAVLKASLPVMVENPGATKADVPRLVFKVWESVRAETMADGLTVEKALTAPPSQYPIVRIGELLNALIVAGDLRKTLEAKRAEIDRALAALP